MAENTLKCIPGSYGKPHYYLFYKSDILYKISYMNKISNMSSKISYMLNKISDMLYKIS